MRYRVYYPYNTVNIPEFSALSDKCKLLYFYIAATIDFMDDECNWISDHVFMIAGLLGCGEEEINQLCAAYCMEEIEEN